MADELGTSIRSNLSDKSRENQKQAALDIENEIRTVLRGGSTSFGSGTIHDQVARFVRALVEDFCRSAFPVRRRGGLMGLASVVIALEHGPAQEHVSQLVPPVITCFSDEDPQVRYSACEAFYNIAKVARGGILTHLEQVYDGLCRLSADVDESVQEGAQCLDRLVRDIVTECRTFDYSAFIPVLTTRMRALNNCVRQLVLGWIVLLDSLPQVDMIAYLPQYLEGLFGILASNDRDIRHSTQVCLDELLSEIKALKAERPKRAQLAIADAAPTVARCCRAGERRAEDNGVRLKALDWLLEFVKLQLPAGGTTVEAELEGTTLDDASHQCLPLPEPHPTTSALRYSSSIYLTHSRAVSAGDAARPGVDASLDSVAAGCSEGGGTNAGGLRQLVPVLLAGALHCLDDSEGEIRQNAEQANAALSDAARYLGSDLPFQTIADVVLEAMWSNTDGQERSPAVLLNCLNWLQLLLTQCRSQVLEPAVRARLFDATLRVLSRPEDEVAKKALRLIASLVTLNDHSPVPEAEGDQFARMCQRLFRLMAEDLAVLSNRGELVVRQLCDGVKAERLFATAARSVAGEKDLPYARRLVRVLNKVLLTAHETRGLRRRLRADATTSPRPGSSGQVPALLLELLLSWFHCPVSTLALCLWLHWFELAAEITARLAGMEMTAELQANLTDFIELFESPVFMRVRLQLLSTKGRPALLHTVHGLIALLPKERALRARLDIVQTGFLLDRLGPPTTSALAKGAPDKPAALATQRLLARFDNTIDAHGLRKCVM